jgi:TonB family protein
MGITGRSLFDDDREPRMAWMILLSIIFHLTAILIVVNFSPFPPRKKILSFPGYSVYAVNLVSLPEEKPKTSRPEAKILKTKAAQKKPKKEAIKIAPRVVKKRLEPKKIIAAKKKKAPPDSWQKVSSAIEEIKKKVSARQENLAKETGNSHQPPSEKALGRAVPYEEINLKLKIYYSLIWEKIRKGWVLPSMIPGSEELETIIAIKIQKDGEIIAIDYEKRSKNPHFDESALRAIKKANPLPPIPPEYQGGSLELGIRFHPSELL